MQLLAPLLSYFTGTQFPPVFSFFFRAKRNTTKRNTAKGLNATPRSTTILLYGNTIPTRLFFLFSSDVLEIQSRKRTKRVKGARPLKAKFEPLFLQIEPCDQKFITEDTKIC